MAVEPGPTFKDDHSPLGTTEEKQPVGEWPGDATQPVSFFSLSPELLWVLDSTGYLRSLNPAVRTILGFTPEEMTGAYVFDYLHPDDAAGSQRALGQITSGQPIYDFVNRYRCKDGSYRSISWTAALSGDLLYAAGRDVTEKIRAEESARESHRFVQSTLDALLTHIAVLDENGVIVAVNKAWREFAAANGGNLIACGVGVNYLEACRPKDERDGDEAILVANGIQRIMAGEQNTFSLEYSCHDEKEQRWFLVHVTRFAGPGPLRVVVSHENITERKLVEGRLWKSERQYRAIFENSLDAIIIIDDGGNFLDANPAACKVYEVDREKLLTLNVAVFTQPDWEGLGPFLESGRQEDEYEIVLLDKSTKRVEYAATANFLPGLHLISLRDVTERRQAEVAVRESEERLRLVSDNARVGMVMVDREYRYIYANPTYAKIMGLPSSPLAGQRVPDVLPALFEDQIRPRLDRAFRGERVTYELHRPTERETHYYIVRYEPTKLNGLVTHVVVVIVDITERKLAEEALQQSEAALQRANEELEHRVLERTRAFQQANESLRLEAIERKKAMIALEETAEAFRATERMLQLVMNHIPEAIFWKDRNSVYLGCNDRFSSDAGLSCPEEVVGKTDLEMPWAQYAAEYQVDDRQVMNEDRPKLNIEEPLIKANGEESWLRTNKVPLHDAEDNVMGVLCSYEEITEQKKAETALREARQEAEAASHAKSEFLSRMSHELRTPLNAVLGFGQILEMRTLAPKEARAVDQILRAGRHLLNLINEVLDITRIETGHISLSIEPVEVLAVVREAMNLVLPLAAEREISLLNDIDPRDAPPGGWHVSADRQRLCQVMLNLLSNAIKYNRDGGRVMVWLQEMPPEGEDGQPALRISIHDTGLGIDAADRAKLFVPFERFGTEIAKIEGTGIGLALSKRLTELMGGTVGMESELGKGSTFWIQLPAAERPATPKREGRQEPASPVSSLLDVDRPVTVLYVEDNASNLSVMENLMDEMPQVRLLTAIQGRLGLDLAVQHHPDLILLDLHLPDIQGDEVLRQLRANPATAEIPIIMISADATDNQINRLLAAGAERYLTKPLDIKRLVRVMEEMLQPRD